MTSFWTEAVGGAQCHCCWAHQQRKRKVSLGKRASSVWTLLLWPLRPGAHSAIPDATDAQGWTTSAGLVILPAWPFAAFCSSDSLEASAWWCHWLIGTPLPQTLPYTQTSNLSPAEQLTREPGRVLCLAHIYILAYALTK